MTATFIVGKTVKTVESGLTVEEAIRSLDMKPDSYLFLADGKPVPMDTPVEDGMTVKVVKVASGG